MDFLDIQRLEKILVRIAVALETIAENTGVVEPFGINFSSSNTYDCEDR